ncbi:maestro heat-like repeat-containing protein family member 6 [Pithys albifrons albifrons]|uniref:maestro heat-like repeat-containing protein family member 6 n=1 Tax=Pithys albifrons albifrons TaxID=3385563 RepID=UPI003A5CEDEB
MAGGCFSLFRLFRRKKKNRKGPGAAPAQKPEEVQHFQPQQQDPARDRTQEQHRARGRFRRAVQRLLKFMAIRRRTARTTPADAVAQSDTRPSKIEVKADVHPAPVDGAENSDMASADGKETCDTAPTVDKANCDMEPIQARANWHSVPADGTEASDMAARNGTDNCESAPGDDAATSSMSPSDGTDSSDTSLSSAITNADPAPEDRETTEVPPSDDTDTCEPAPIDGITSDTAWTDDPDSVLTDDMTDSDTAATDAMAKDDAMAKGIGSTAVTEALNPEDFQEKDVPSAKQVPAIVRYIHQWLMCQWSPDVTPPRNICSLADAHPHDVVTTLLRCAPSCDRAAAILWRTMASSGTTAQKVLPTLLGVMEDWPLHSTATSDGDDTHVCALAATLALWLMVQEPQCQDALRIYAPHLLLALLSQVHMSTEQMPQELNTFWRTCQDQHGLPTNPNSFAVHTIKALLCRLHWDNEVVSVEHKRGWDMLLCADTYHYAVGLLAREMTHVLVPRDSLIPTHLLGLLSREEPCWELPALTFLVELLDGLDVSKWHQSVLQVLSRHLRSECPKRRRLALRGLMVLSEDPSMVKSLCSHSESLLELLCDGDRELVIMSLSVFLNVLREEDSRALSSTAPRLAEALLPLFDNDNCHLRLLSICLLRELVELLAEEGAKAWKTLMRQSLVPLFFHWHDKNQRVAEASRGMLHRAATFLKRRDLEQLIKTEKPFKFCDHLMEKDVTRRAKYLRQALPYLQSPQEPLRKAALKFMGLAKWHMKDQPKDLARIIKALDDAMSEETCPAYTNMRFAVWDTYRRAVENSSAPPRHPTSQRQDRNKAPTPRLCGAGAPPSSELQ